MKCIKLDFTKSLNHNYADDTDLTLIGGGGNNYPILVSDEGSTSLYLDPNASYQGFQVPYDHSKYNLESKDFYLKLRLKIPANVLDYASSNQMTIIGSRYRNDTLAIGLNNGVVYSYRYFAADDVYIQWGGIPTDLKYHTYEFIRQDSILSFYFDHSFIGKGKSSAWQFGGGYPFGIFYLQDQDNAYWYPLKGLVKNFVFYIDDIEEVVKGNSVIFNNLKSD